MIPLQLTNHGFNHGFKVVRNRFRPSTVLLLVLRGMGSKSHASRLEIPVMWSVSHLAVAQKTGKFQNGALVNGTKD